jgi:hypothetical protein
MYNVQSAADPVMRHPSLLAAAILLAACLAASNPAIAAVLVTTNKAAQRMTVAADGDARYSWPVSTGTKGYATPAGSFRPFRLEEDHFSKEWDDAPMPHSIFFTAAGHAIHGTNAVRRLGSRASHGCVRLAPVNAATLFELVRSEGLGRTKIVVTGAEPTRVAKRGTDKYRRARYRAQSNDYSTGYADPYYEYGTTPVNVRTW